MKRLITKTLLCSAVAAGLFLVVQGTANAAITGNCVACHTMHNSQDGSSFGTTATTSAQNNLLLNGCLGCHTGTSTELATAGVNTAYSAPVVLATGSAPTKELAGGNFYWSAFGYGATASKGHNVSDITGNVDANQTAAPGGTYTLAALECSSCHRGGGHHTGGSGGATDGLTAATSYRFLSGAVQGFEDTDWEFSVSTTDHNVYYGSSDNDATGTISAHCALCHGDFHGSASNETGRAEGLSTPWTRHPTDITLGSANTAGGGSTEYADYGSYSIVAPVGSTVTTTAGTNSGTIVLGTNDVVVCTSCHRAHGSDEPDMLRWSYSAMNAGSSGTTGCFTCHTTK